MNRRQFVCAAAACAATFARASHALAATVDKYDLIIRGGRVIDPSIQLDASRDVAISEGRISAVSANISSDAAEIIDARGKIVVPGLLDIHTHVARSAEGPALVLKDGVTGWIDAGSQGADHIGDTIAIARSSPQQGRVLINIGRAGILTDGDTMDLRLADVSAAHDAIAKNRDFIAGVKARLSGNVAGPNDYEVLRRTQEVARAFNLPVMIHMGQTMSPLRKLLPLLKRGDVVTHMFAPPPNSIIDEMGQILPEVLAARRRGVWFDVGNGVNGHLRWDIVDAVMKQKFWPDTISTDWNTTSPTTGVVDLPNCVSKCLNYGMSVARAVACVTINASRVFPVFKNRGTLRVGAPADVALLELREGNFEFQDNFNNTTTGHQRLFPRGTVLAGKRVSIIIAAIWVAVAQTARAQVPADVLKLEPYSLRTYDGQAHDIELGRLTVPESRVHPTGRNMSVAFFRLKSTSATPRSPIVFLMGGPGIPASVIAPIPPYWQLFDALRASGDVILLDQRGLGLSSPKVDCPPLAQPLDANFLTSHAAFIAAYRRVLGSCAAHWRSKGVDPRGFTDAEIVDDVDDIRRALDAQRVSLLGFSYGTRLAMTFARRHPDRLDRIALQGPTDADLEYHESLTYDSLLTRFAQLAAADPVSAPYSADLVARMKALFARADREPISVTVRRTSGDSIMVRVGGDVLRGLVTGHVADVRLPALVATMERGDHAILTLWVEGLYNDFNAGAGTLMARAVNCSSVPSNARRSRVDAAAAASIFGRAFDNFAADRSFCAVLGGDPAKPPSHLRAPLESAALFVTGELDDRTPIGNDVILSREFRESIRIHALNGGHEVLPDPSVRQLVTDFFLGRDVRDRSIRLAPPRFLSIEEAKLPPRRPGE